jgi:hypothetical protein
MIICTMDCALQEYRAGANTTWERKVEQCIIINLKMKMAVFWDVVLCSLAKVY